MIHPKRTNKTELNWMWINLLIYCSLIVIFFWGYLEKSIPYNLANVILFKTLNQTHISAEVRQQSLNIAANLLDGTLSEVQGEPYPMIPAIMQGEYYRHVGNIQQAAYWYKIASASAPYPVIQQPLVIPTSINLTQQGNILLNGSDPYWQTRRDTIPTTTIRPTTEGTGKFSFLAEPAQENRAAFQWNYPFNLSYHHTIQLKVKAPVNTTVIFETVIDGKISRHLTEDGTGKWETYTIPVKGNNLTLIYVLFNDKTNVKQEIERSMEIKEIVFLLDESVFSREK